MVKRLLRSVRQKPKAVRDQIALAAAGVVTGTIFVFWLFNGATKVDVSEVVKDGESLRHEAGFANVFDGLGDQIKQLKNASSSQISDSEISTSTQTNTISREEISDYELVYPDSETVYVSATSGQQVSDSEEKSEPEIEDESSDDVSAGREVRIMPVESSSSSSSQDPSF